MKTTPIFALALLISACPLLASSSIINFTGDDPANVDVSFTNLSSSWVSGVYSKNYSDSNQVFAGDTANGCPALSGGVYATNSGITVGSFAQLHEPSVSPDQFQIGWARDGGTTNTSFRFLFMSLDQNWLAFNSGAQFDATSSFSISTLATNQTSIGSINFVIEDSGLYYISQSRISATMSTFTLSDPNTSLWAQFTPTTINFGGVDPTTVSGSQHTFNNVQAVGFFVQGVSVWGGTQPGTISLNKFSVTAAKAVPEPATAWLFVCGLAYIGVSRLRTIKGAQKSL